jgi:non-ribosomal peptide synthetase component E (peptide arylation enzyme)
MPPNYMDLTIERAEPLEFHNAGLGRLRAFVVHRRSYHSISHTGESRAAVALSSSCPIRFECEIAYLALLKVGAIPDARLPVHGHTEIGHLARFTEAAAWLIPAEHRRFDFIAMAQQLRGNR